MAAEEDKLEIIPERSVEVRETRKLFRLAPAAENDRSRSSRQVAIIAADIEDDGPTDRGHARRIRTRLAGSAFRRVRQPGNIGAHVFGDVIFRSEPLSVEGRKRAAKHR